MRSRSSVLQGMKRQGVFPDYVAVDGAEGGTGAAPKSFMDGVGLPIFESLPRVQALLEEEGVRPKVKLLASGKLIDARRQLIAMSMGANACLTARGFMLALGCIQALQCNQNTCPVGITTALLAVGVMCGAIIAHVTVLGIDLKHSWLLLTVLVSALIVLYVRRGDLPIVGRTFGSGSRSVP